MDKRILNSELYTSSFKKKPSRIKGKVKLRQVSLKGREKRAEERVAKYREAAKGDSDRAETKRERGIQCQ